MIQNPAIQGGGGVETVQGTCVDIGIRSSFLNITWSDGKQLTINGTFGDTPKTITVVKGSYIHMNVGARKEVTGGLEYVPLSSYYMVTGDFSVTAFD